MHTLRTGDIASKRAAIFELEESYPDYNDLLAESRELHGGAEVGRMPDDRRAARASAFIARTIEDADGFARATKTTGASAGGSGPGPGSRLALCNRQNDARARGWHRSQRRAGTPRV